MSDASSNSPSSQPARFSFSFGGPARIIFVALAIFIVSQFVAALLVEAGAQVLLTSHLTQSVIEYSSFAQFVYILLAEATVVGAVLMILKKRQLPLSAIGLGRKPKLKDLNAAIGGYLAYFLAVLVVIVILSALFSGFQTNQNQDVGFNNISSGADRWLAFVSLVILPPIAEEILMRGYLFSGLRKHWSFIQAGIVTSILFGAAHLLTGATGLLWTAGVGTFVLSMVLVYLREKTGALYAGMLVHAINNIIAFGVHFHAKLF